MIARILDSVDPQPAEHLAEFGPGKGALTNGLLQRAESPGAIELDRDRTSHCFNAAHPWVRPTCTTQTHCVSTSIR
ncbi:MAG: rRNA adenine N-6-methyltransferase family protein [Sedimenticolaceae bacterium]